MAARLVPTGMTVPIRRGPLRGRKWIVGAAAGEGKGLSVILNRAEPEQMRQARRLVSPDSICFDIGANVGLYTLLFARYARHVYAFEPWPRNVRFLSRLLEINRVPNATIVPWAVSATTEFASFQAGSNCATGKLSRQGKQPVAAISCDNFVATYNVVPSLLKIDVEGAELAVLQGAANLLTQQRPDILLSTHGADIKDSCLTYLRQLGYNRMEALDSDDIDTAADFMIRS